MPAPPPDATLPSARIGAFLPIDTGYGREVLRGIGRFKQDNPHLEVLKFSETLGEFPEKIRELKLDGIIAKITGRRSEENFLGLSIPVINFSGQYQTQSIPTVTTDDRRLGTMALKHFAQRGFRHFAFCGTAAHFASRLRLEAYEKAVRERFADATVATLFVPDGDQDAPFPEHVREELAAWIGAQAKPLGVFTFTDRLGLEVDEACRRARLRVPDEVGILGVGNDLTRIEFAHVPLSSIELPTEQNGYDAARLLERWRVEGERPPPYTVLRPRRLITRRSTDGLAVADESVAVALEYIQEHLGNPIRVPEVARAAGVSRRTLEERFRQQLGQPIFRLRPRAEIRPCQGIAGRPEHTDRGYRGASRFFRNEGFLPRLSHPLRHQSIELPARNPALRAGGQKPFAPSPGRCRNAPFRFVPSPSAPAEPAIDTKFSPRIAFRKMDLSVIASNLLQPPILCFFLGVGACLVRSDLDFPSPLPKLFSLYLLFAIGFKGGIGLQASGFSLGTVLTMGAGVLLGFVIPIYTFFLLRHRVGAANAAAIAATYGSISAVTFITATVYLDERGIAFGSHMIATMALMESPAIISGVMLARFFGDKSTAVSDPPSRPRKSLDILHEAFFNGSVVLLLGAMLIGFLTGERGQVTLHPFTHEIFTGMLCLFLLDLGIVSARRLEALRAVGPILVIFALVIPLPNAALGLGLSWLLDLSVGNAVLLTVLAASASYIAVPAAMRLALPEAKSSLFLPMSLGLTFPFNIIVGIPLYHALAVAIGL
jgi:DNA-binding LacI/PurR family transcriptional regulator